MSNLITITPNAEKEILKLLEEANFYTPCAGLRLGIGGGGCSGLTYKLDFTEKEEGDTVLEFFDESGVGFCVFLDRKSIIYLSGITLDHQSGLGGKGFVFQNPQATNTCGCGESFSI